MQSGRGSQRKLSAFLVQKWRNGGKAKTVSSHSVILATQLEPQGLSSQKSQVSAKSLARGCSRMASSRTITILSPPGSHEAVWDLQNACTQVGYPYPGSPGLSCYPRTCPTPCEPMALPALGFQQCCTTVTSTRGFTLGDSREFPFPDAHIFYFRVNLPWHLSCPHQPMSHGHLWPHVATSPLDDALPLFHPCLSARVYASLQPTLLPTLNPPFPHPMSPEELLLQLASRQITSPYHCPWSPTIQLALLLDATHLDCCAPTWMPGCCGRSCQKPS